MRFVRCQMLLELVAGFDLRGSCYVQLFFCFLPSRVFFCFFPLPWLLSLMAPAPLPIAAGSLVALADSLFTDHPSLPCRPKEPAARSPVVSLLKMACS